MKSVFKFIACLIILGSCFESRACSRIMPDNYYDVGYVPSGFGLGSMSTLTSLVSGFAVMFEPETTNKNFAYGALVINYILGCGGAFNNKSTFVDSKTEKNDKKKVTIVSDEDKRKKMIEEYKVGERRRNYYILGWGMAVNIGHALVAKKEINQIIGWAGAGALLTYYLLDPNDVTWFSSKKYSFAPSKFRDNSYGLSFLMVF